MFRHSCTIDDACSHSVRLWWTGLVDDVAVPSPLSLHAPENWPEVLTTTQVAELLAIDRQTVLRMIHRDELPASRVGKVWRIAPEDIWPFVPPGIRARWPDGPWTEPS